MRALQFSMGLSCGENDFDKKEGEVPDEELVDDDEPRRSESTTSSGTRQRGVGGGVGEMEVAQYQCHHGVVEFGADFWPVEHPMEPQDDDRPVKCPVSTSSVIDEERMNEERYAESLRKRAEVPAAEVNKQGIVVKAAEPPVRAVRKRHHTLASGGSRVVTRMPPPPPPPFPTPPAGRNNATIFQMLQHLDEFQY